MKTINDILQKGNLTTIQYDEWLEFYRQRDTENIWFTAKPLDEMHNQRMSVGLSGFLCGTEKEIFFIVRNTHSGLVRVLNKTNFTSEFQGVVFTFPDLWSKRNEFLIKSNHLLCEESPHYFENIKFFKYDDFFDYFWLHNGRQVVPKANIQGLFNLPNHYDWLVYDRIDQRYAFFGDNGVELEDLQNIFDRGNVITTVDQYPENNILTFIMGNLVISDLETRMDKISIPLNDPERVSDVFRLVDAFISHKNATTTFIKSMK